MDSREYQEERKEAFALQACIFYWSCCWLNDDFEFERETDRERSEWRAQAERRQSPWIKPHASLRACPIMS